jgi:hypothetical protein
MTTEIDLLTTKQRLITQSFDSFKIVSIFIHLDSKADINVHLLLSHLEERHDRTIKIYDFVSEITVILEGEDYNNWGNDDSYIINYISNYVMNI